jgi:hypothetical protein
LRRSIWLLLILSSSQQTAHGPLQEKAPKIFVENGRAIVYVHPYTTKKLWMKTLFKNLNSLFARRSARSREAKPFEFRPQCF